MLLNDLPEQEENRGEHRQRKRGENTEGGRKKGQERDKGRERGEEKLGNLRKVTISNVKVVLHILDAAVLDKFRLQGFAASC
jgi:hypothetical protein